MVYKKKRKKNVGGRPPKITNDTLQKLETSFSMGCSDKEACLYADIVPSTLYEYQKKHPEYKERKAMLKERMVLKARNNILKSLQSEDPKERIDTSKWYLERKRKDEFSQRQEMLVEDVMPANPVDPFAFFAVETKEDIEKVKNIFSKEEEEEEEE